MVSPHDRAWGMGSIWWRAHLVGYIASRNTTATAQFFTPSSISALALWPTSMRKTSIQVMTSSSASIESMVPSTRCCDHGRPSTRSPYQRYLAAHAPGDRAKKHGKVARASRGRPPLGVCHRALQTAQDAVSLITSLTTKIS